MTSTLSVPNKENKGYANLRNEHGEGDEETTIQTSDMLSRSLSEENVKQTSVDTVRDNESSNQPENVVDRLSKSNIAYTPDIESRRSLVVSQSDGACDGSILCREKRVYHKDEVDVVNSDGSQLTLLNQVMKPSSTAKTVNSITETVCLECPKPKLSINDTHFTQKGQLCRELLTCSEDVPKIFDKPSDSDESGTEFEENLMPLYPEPGLPYERRDSRSQGGLWRIYIRHMRPNIDGTYARTRLNSPIEDFLPIPGDIMITHTPRRPFLASYLAPNPGGNVTVFVDRNYFQRDQNAREEIQHQMARFFEPNDMIIRFGRFFPGWQWRAHARIEFFVYRQGRGRNDGPDLRWYMHSRLPNNIKLAPPDPYCAASMVQNRVVPDAPSPGCLLTRTTDIFIRPILNDTFMLDDEIPQFTRDSDFLDGDLLIRLSIQKWLSNPIYRKFTVDLYMVERLSTLRLFSRDATNWNWIFRGRDVQLFGPPHLDQNGREQVLDQNGIEPFVRRPIPHWGLARAVFGIDAPPGLRP